MKDGGRVRQQSVGRQGESIYMAKNDEEGEEAEEEEEEEELGAGESLVLCVGVVLLLCYAVL